jgi:hypothetical protein
MKPEASVKVSLPLLRKIDRLIGDGLSRSASDAFALDLPAGPQ